MNIHYSWIADGIKYAVQRNTTQSNKTETDGENQRMWSCLQNMSSSLTSSSQTKHRERVVCWSTYGNRLALFRTPVSALIPASWCVDDFLGQWVRIPAGVPSPGFKKGNAVYVQASLNPRGDASRFSLPE